MCGWNNNSLTNSCLLFHAVYAGILIATDQDCASEIAKEICETQILTRILGRIIDAESKFGVRVVPKNDGAMHRQTSGRMNHVQHSSQEKPKFQDLLTFCKLTRADRKATQRQKKAAPSKSVSSGGTVYVSRPDQTATKSRRSRPTIMALESFESAKHEDDSTNNESKSAKHSSSMFLNRFLSSKSQSSETNVGIGQVSHALHMTDHIIVFGCKENMTSFVDFVDLPLVNTMNEGESRSMVSNSLQNGSK